MTGTEFEQLMRKAGHSQTSLAELFCVTRQTIGKYCNSPTVESIVEYAIKAVVYEKAVADIKEIINAYEHP